MTGVQTCALPILNVGERRRHRNPGPNREAQTVCLFRAVVRVLAEDHHAGSLERSEVKRGEHFVGRRKHGVPLSLCSDELLQVTPVRLGEFAAQHRVPVGGGHGNSLAAVPAGEATLAA